MTGFKKEQRGENTFLTYAVEEDNLDSVLSGMLLRNHIPGLLAYSSAQVDRDRICSYNITSKVTLKQYFSHPVNRERLLKVFMGILNTVTEAEEYLIRQSDLLFDSEYIYVSVSDGMPALLCLPVKREAEGADMFAFFRQIMFEANFDEKEDRGYVAELISFMKRPEATRYSEFRRYLEGMSRPNRPAPSREFRPAPKPAPQPVSAAPSSPVESPREEPKEKAEEGKKRFGLFGGGKKEKKEKKGKEPKPAKEKRSGLGFSVPGMETEEPVGRKEENRAAEPVPVGGPGPAPRPEPARPSPVAVVDLTSEETVVMGSGGILGGKGTPWLVHLRTGTAQPVDRFPFRIGKERSYVDFCVTGNAAVSRSHADIQSDEQGGFWLIDNNSKNHSYIDKERLLPGQPYPLLPGAHFFLANEEFVFELR